MWRQQAWRWGWLGQPCQDTSLWIGSPYSSKIPTLWWVGSPRIMDLITFTWIKLAKICYRWSEHEKYFNLCLRSTFKIWMEVGWCLLMGFPMGWKGGLGTDKKFIKLTVRKLEKMGLPSIISTMTPFFPSMMVEHIVMFLRKCCGSSPPE